MPNEVTIINATIMTIWCIVCIYRGIVCWYMSYNSFYGVVWCVCRLPRMFIYPTDLNHRITQINQFLYISTEFLRPYIHMFYYIYDINNNNHHGFFICIYIYIYICPPFLCVYTYVYFSIYIFYFSHNISVDRPSRSQCVLNRLPHAAHTTIP